MISSHCHSQKSCLLLYKEETLTNIGAVKVWFAFFYSVLRSTLSHMQSCLFVDQGCQINNLWCSMNQLLSIYFPLLVTANTPDERGQLLPPACHPPWNIVWKQKAEKAKQNTHIFNFLILWYDTDLPAQVAGLKRYQYKQSFYFAMKVPTALFKTTISLLVFALLFLLYTFHEEIQRNRDLYKGVLALHEDVSDVTVERQVCSNRIGREEMIIVDRVSYKQHCSSDPNLLLRL